MIKVYKVERPALKEVKKVVEEPEAMKETSPGKTEWVKNDFARNGYVLKDVIKGVQGDAAYLYIDAPEAFFKAHEKRILVKGVMELKGKDYEDIKAKIEEEQSGAAAGIGAIFG